MPTAEPVKEEHPLAFLVLPFVAILCLCVGFGFSFVVRPEPKAVAAPALVAAAPTPIVPAVLSSPYIDREETDLKMYAMIGIGCTFEFGQSRAALALCEHTASRIAAKGIKRGPGDGPWTADEVGELVYQVQECWRRKSASPLSLPSVCDSIVNKVTAGMSYVETRTAICGFYDRLPDRQ